MPVEGYEYTYNKGRLLREMKAREPWRQTSMF